MYLCASGRVFLTMIDHERPLRGNVIDLVNRSMYLFQELLENYIVFVRSINRARGDRREERGRGWPSLPSRSLSSFFSTAEREKEHEHSSTSIHQRHCLKSCSRWDCFDRMQPFIEQPQFLLEPKSSYLLDTKPVQLECQAIRTRQIFFNCDNKWLPEQEHRKSTTLNVSSAIHLDIERRNSSLSLPSG